MYENGHFWTLLQHGKLFQILAIFNKSFSVLRKIISIFIFINIFSKKFRGQRNAKTTSFLTLEHSSVAQSYAMTTGISTSYMSHTATLNRVEQAGKFSDESREYPVSITVFPVTGKILQLLRFSS